MAKPTTITYPQYVIGPQGNKIGVRGGVMMYPTQQPGPANPAPPAHDVPFNPPPIVVGPVRHPPIIYPPDPKPPIKVGPMPPIRVNPLPTPPIFQPGRRRKRHWREHREDIRTGVMRPRKRYARPMPVFRHRRRRPDVIYIKQPASTPAPVIAPVATGKTCPTWGFMTRKNPDGSETVIQCTPGQPAAAGLSGLDGFLDEISGGNGSLLLYAGLAVGAWLLLKKK